jgi:cytidylate kinase
MAAMTTSERLAEAIERTRRQWHARHKAQAGDGPAAQPAPPGFTIALSREAGANGSLVARAVGEQLGWAVYDRELLQRVAEEMGLLASLVEGADEKTKNWLAKYLQTLSRTAPVVSGIGYARHLAETLLSLAAHGECVVVGRGAAQVLPAATTLRVRLVAPVADRVKTLQQRLGVTQEEAARRVARMDDERVRFVKEFFRKDAADQAQYDLILNSSRFSPSECAALIIEALHRLQSHAAPMAQPALAVS